MRRIISILLFIAIVVGLNLLSNYNKKKALKWSYEVEIIGIIDEIHYDAKENAIVKIEKTDYNLTKFLIRKRNYFREGDSIYKKHNSNYLKHFRRNSMGFYLDETYELRKGTGVN